jgi:hypothetical protein
MGDTRLNGASICSLLAIHEYRGHVSVSWCLWFCIYDASIGRYLYEEKEEERQQHHSYNNVENRFGKRGDRLDIYDAEQRWADNLVPAPRSSINITPTSQSTSVGSTYPIVWITLIAPNNRPDSDGTPPRRV